MHAGSSTIQLKQVCKYVREDGQKKIEAIIICNSHLLQPQFLHTDCQQSLQNPLTFGNGKEQNFHIQQLSQNVSVVDPSEAGPEASYCDAMPESQQRRKDESCQSVGNYFSQR